MYRRRLLRDISMGAATALVGKRAGAATPGVTEIKIGSTNALSGPASANGVMARTQAAYFQMINEQGGVAGRKINFIYYDDGYSPPKTVEMVRKLVENDRIDCLFGTLGTATNSVITPYCNHNHVPQLFISTGAEKFGDFVRYPWTVGFNPSAGMKAKIYAKYIRREISRPKIAVLYQNDDFGTDYLNGLNDGLGSAAETLVVKTASYEAADQTIDSQMVALQNSGANVLFSAATPKAAAQAIRRAAELNWKPLHIVATTSTSREAVLRPAGLNHSTGLIAAAYIKDATDPRWDDDPGMKDWRAFMAGYLPGVDQADEHTVRAYAMAFMMTQVLRQCGDDFSRENLRDQALALKDLRVPVFLPGITASTSPTNHEPIQALQLTRFNGRSWEPFGDVIQGSEV